MSEGQEYFRNSGNFYFRTIGQLYEFIFNLVFFLFDNIEEHLVSLSVPKSFRALVY